MHVRNAILVLQKVSKVFPMAAVDAKGSGDIDVALDQFLKKEKKGSLQVLCQSYHSTLHRRKKEWSLSTEKPSVKSVIGTQPTRPVGDRRESATAVPGVERPIANGTPDLRVGTPSSMPRPTR